MAPEVCSFTGLELSNLPLGDKPNNELNSKKPYLTFSMIQKEFYILNDISQVLRTSKDIKYCKDIIC